LGANVYQVRELLNKSPGRNMLLPGAGVGGHCIPKDPWLLIANVTEAYQSRLIPAARAVNDQMPYHVVDLIRQGLAEHQLELNGAKIAILGYAFREDTDDDRESPSFYLVEELRRFEANPVIHDPYVKPYQKSLTDVLTGASIAVMMVAHQPYRNMDLTTLYDVMKCPIIVDGRNVVNGGEAKRMGFTYLGIGNL
jgi:UDP-N-acetyl-D-mannosaminuronic acid dehydrogenase